MPNGALLKTGASGSVGVIFNDDTRLLKGTFAFVTGQIARLAPDKVQLSTPDATLGLRGNFLSSPSNKTTTVVLLASGEGRVGKIRMSSDSGSVELDQPAQGTVVSGAKTAPAAPETWRRERIDATFAKVLTSLPTAPEYFILHFDEGTSELTGESSALLPEIENAIDRRNTVDIRKIGHCDTAGNLKFNLRLSQERALAVARIPVDRGVPETHLFTTSHGKTTR